MQKHGALMTLSLSHLLAQKKSFIDGNDYKQETYDLQLQMERIQQGIWHRKDRVIIMFEGFDAAGKGGAIKKLTEMLDPRGTIVHPIGPPSEEERDKHWLYRFWAKLPASGSIAVFDRSWYGRVLVERVDKLIEKEKWESAFEEINQFEKTLQSDGIKIIKIFLAITKDEQFRRFEDRINDPYKQWKITMDDIRARKKWDKYVEAVDEIFQKTNPKTSPWHLIPANAKHFARKEALKIVTSELAFWGKWMDKEAKKYEKSDIKKLLEKT
jgi:polyphosphate kinase 2 (PPK2 family)